MGAIFNFQRLKSKTSPDALREANDVIAAAAYEHGHGGYTGSFAEARGAEIASFTPDGAAQAEEWLDENAEKWGSALLVQDKAGVWYMGALCSS